jgi:predicted nucleic acid-binding protein
VIVTSADDIWAVDTSVAVAALDQSHEFHATCRAAVLAHRPALAGHAAFETFSVLTRLPGALRVEPADAAAVLAQGFPEQCWLDARRQTALRARLGELGLAGGSVYDALVAAAAMAHGRRLLSRDTRAERTYQLIGVEYEWVGPR